MSEVSQGLHRSRLRTLEAMALSISIMAPSAAMAVTPAFAAATDGASASLSFLIAVITALFVAYSFLRFTGYHAHAGSIYAFNAAALGRPFGFVSGWVLLPVYLMFAGGTIAQFADYFQVVLSAGHISVPWLPLALIIWIVVGLFAYLSIELSTRLMLAIEGISVLLILIVAVAILAHGGAQGLNLRPFSLNHQPVSAVGFAMVFAFLSFAGFEGAATLGEETANPRRAIPRAILTALVGVGVFYVFMTWVETMGYGLGNIKDFAASGAPLAYLAGKYMSGGMGTVIYVGASISAFGCALGSTNAAARLIFSMTRDGFLHKRFAEAHPKSGAPAAAVVLVSVISLLSFLLFASQSAADVFNYLGTVGVLFVLIAYALTSLSAMVFFLRKKFNVWDLVIPAVAILLLGYVFWSNVYPVPAAPYNLFPYAVLVWIVIGVLIVALNRGLKERLATSTLFSVEANASD